MWEAITTIVGKAQSELFLFLILLVVFAIVIIRPTLTYFKNRKEQELTRETNILGVIKGNTVVMTEIKTLLKSTNDNCRLCKNEQLQRFKCMEDKIDENLLMCNDIKELIIAR
jgi:sugar-specific transcriptional regulator TrmB